MENYNENIQQEPQEPLETQTADQSNKQKLWYVLVPILLILVALVIWLIYNTNLPKETSPQDVTTEESIPTNNISSEESLLSNTQSQPTEAIKTKLYSSSENGYSFEYEESWYVSGFGNLAILSEKPIPTNDFSSLLLADALVSPVPYASIQTAPGVTATMDPPFKSHEGQVMDFAQQLDTSSTSLQPIKINGLVGYSAVYVSDGVATYNVLLEGKKNMLLVQFPRKNSRSSLSKSQLTILNTIQEK